MSYDDDRPPKESPDCATCDDQGFVPDLTGETGTANCPDCNPTLEQAAATTAEYQRWAFVRHSFADPF